MKKSSAMHGTEVICHWWNRFQEVRWWRRSEHVCSRKPEAGGFVISQHSLQHFMFERERKNRLRCYLWPGFEWKQKKKRSFLQPFSFDPYSYGSSVGLPGSICFLSHLRAPVPALAQISAGIVNDNRTDPSGSVSLLSCLHLLLSHSSLSLSVFLLRLVDLQLSFLRV